jgi:hypothetical protein
MKKEKQMYESTKEIKHVDVPPLRVLGYCLGNKFGIQVVKSRIMGRCLGCQGLMDIK